VLEAYPHYSIIALPIKRFSCEQKSLVFSYARWEKVRPVIDDYDQVFLLNSDVCVVG
jgi:hypothetical protein